MISKYASHVWSTLLVIADRRPAAQFARCFKEGEHDSVANEVSGTGQVERIADLAVLEPFHNWMVLNRKE